MKTINVIGTGRVGRTLGRLWRQQEVFTVQDLLARDPGGTQEAAGFVGAGRAVAGLREMRPADVWLLAPPDSRIAECVDALAASGLVRPGDIVFHCSGALASGVLAAASASGAHAASVHPLKTFADPAEAARTFAGTWCTVEGARAALDVLRPAFERIGGQIVAIDPQAKTLYHAASVMVCNYLTALLECGLRATDAAGIPRATAQAMLAPLVRETLANVFRLGPVGALTGPIARGDADVVERQLAALPDETLRCVYRALGAVAVELARQQGEADAAALERLRRMLD